MLISQPAMAYLEAAWRQLRGIDGAAAVAPADADPGLGSNEWSADVTIEWRAGSWEGGSTPRTIERDPVETNPADADAHGSRGPLSADERRAQAAAFRASLLARQRRHVEAARAFAEALALDPAIDLTETTSFWDLERAAHLAAADAYEAVGRTRDAMTLRGRVELRFKPRLVRTG